MANRPDKTRGFTLIEILVALTLLTIILGIVYGAYSSVVMSMERARAAAERLKTTQFIVQGFTQNLAQAGEGWLPGAAYRPYSAPGTSSGGQGAALGTGSGTSGNTATTNRGAMRLQFKGTSERGPNGTVDTLSFATSAPIVGGGTLPGQIKLCTYRVEEDSSGDGRAIDPATGEPRKKQMLLVLTETPWTPSNEGSDQNLAAAKTGTQNVRQAFKSTIDAPEQKPVTRSVPIFGWDLSYFDGKQWVEEWDSLETGRLPWSVRVLVKVAQPENDPFANAAKLDPVKDENVLELYFEIPAGEGVHDAPPSYVRPRARGAKV